jgi:hypothetical protein
MMCRVLFTVEFGTAENFSESVVPGPNRTGKYQSTFGIFGLAATNGELSSAKSTAVTYSFFTA